MVKEKKIKLKKAVKMVAALAQETRMSVFRLLMQRAADTDEGLPAGVIAEILDVPSATMSFHLNQLTNAGVLKSVKEGRQVIYSVKKKAVKGLVRFLEEGAPKDEDTEDDNAVSFDDGEINGKARPASVKKAPEKEPAHAV